MTAMSTTKKSIVFLVLAFAISWAIVGAGAAMGAATTQNAPRAANAGCSNLLYFIGIFGSRLARRRTFRPPRQVGNIVESGPSASRHSTNDFNVNRMKIESSGPRPTSLVKSRL